MRLVRYHVGLEGLAVGHRRVERIDLDDRRLQRREAVLGDVAGDEPDTDRVARGLVDEHEASGLRDRLQDRRRGRAARRCAGR